LGAAIGVRDLAVAAQIDAAQHDLAAMGVEEELAAHTHFG
jgi:hypothetical protein